MERQEKKERVGYKSTAIFCKISRDHNSEKVRHLENLRDDRKRTHILKSVWSTEH